LVRQLTHVGKGALVLDVCSGTGDLAIALSHSWRVIGVDFCHPMLVIANRKIHQRELSRRVFMAEADALQLPFCDSVFQAVTVAFGIRNLEDLRCGIQEFVRVLRPGGTLAILEFSQPALPVFRQAFQFYFYRVLPRIGAAVSRSGDAYRYLPESVREFPDQLALCRTLESLGLEDVRYSNFSGGIAALHIARKC
jgi:demethylmenaquinone methyltransferase/2-methoxy-6-polyprenyl-1,4-benzoquinol methylase